MIKSFLQKYVLKLVSMVGVLKLKIKFVLYEMIPNSLKLSKSYTKPKSGDNDLKLIGITLAFYTC